MVACSCAWAEGRKGLNCAGEVVRVTMPGMMMEREERSLIESHDMPISYSVQNTECHLPVQRRLEVMDLGWRHDLRVDDLFSAGCPGSCSADVEWWSGAGSEWSRRLQQPAKDAPGPKRASVDSEDGPLGLSSEVGPWTHPETERFAGLRSAMQEEPHQGTSSSRALEREPCIDTRAPAHPQARVCLSRLGRGLLALVLPARCPALVLFCLVA